MDVTRETAGLFAGRPTIEGAGVHLRRVFGSGLESLFDPFLMLDDFRGDRPVQYEAGFPWHPHRGIETITYMLEGEVDHTDSMGNAGTIGPGDVQWMTAGSGVVHQEMPRGDERGRMGGFQLWANLPAAQKMMNPRYQGFPSQDIPVITSGGATIRVIAGTVGTITGPVRDVVIDPEYLDVTLEPSVVWTHTVPATHTVFAFLFSGGARFGESPAQTAAAQGTAVLLGAGDRVTVTAGVAGARFLLVSGRPLREPVVWRGPIVMNTQQELDEAWRELRAGTFVKSVTSAG